VVLVIAQGAELSVELWRQFADSQGLAFVDALEEARGEELRQAANAWPVFVDWVRRRAVGSGGVVVSEIDTVATRRDEDGRVRLFLKLLRSETRRPGGSEAAPIVVISELAGQCDLPRGSREHGIVVDLSE